MDATRTTNPLAGDALRSRLDSPDAAIPMLPDFAHRVIDLVSDEDVSVSQLSAVVSKDQVLASRLLGLANSAYFAAMSEISTVQDAIVRMGTAAVRNLVVTVCFYSRMQDRNVYGERGKPLLEHGIGTAYMARLVAEKIRADHEEAFMYGLLHDIGKLVILKAAYDVRRQLNAPVPDDVLDEMTYFANRLSHRYGFGCDPDDADLLADSACGQLKVDAAWMAETDKRAPGLFEVAKKILG